MFVILIRRLWWEGGREGARLTGGGTGFGSRTGRLEGFSAEDAGRGMMVEAVSGRRVVGGAGAGVGGVGRLQQRALLAAAAAAAAAVRSRRRRRARGNGGGGRGGG